MLGQCEIYFGRCVSRDAMKQRDWLILLLYFLWNGFDLFLRFFDTFFLLFNFLFNGACFDHGFDQIVSYF